MTRPAIEVFSTCPQSIDCPEGYLQKVIQIARWSERAGCRGILVYTDNQLVDPWLVSQIIIENTTALCPLVAIQPVYMHPYSVAKMISSFGFLYGRQIYLNMVAGGFKNDLLALNDTTPHDRRYDRLVEYTQIIRRLLEGAAPLSYEGEFYKTDKLTLKPSLPAELRPGVLVSGSSDAGLAAARAMGAVAVKYPEPPESCKIDAAEENRGFGIRVGIIAREQEETAWQIAHQRFPDDRKGQIKHELAMKVSDSEWHKRLSEIGAANLKREAYWLGPFQNYKTFCPYLVGNYEQVSGLLSLYIMAGFRTFILDIPASEDELDHINIVFGQATQRMAA